MLIQKGYQEGDIVVFKISTGEEIVAKFIEEKDAGYVVAKPCTVLPSQQGIGLMQSLMCADININVTLNKGLVLMSAPAIDKIQAHYIQTTTGIQTQTAGGIIS